MCIYTHIYFFFFLGYREVYWKNKQKLTRSLNKAHVTLWHACWRPCFMQMRGGAEYTSNKSIKHNSTHTKQSCIKGYIMLFVETAASSNGNHQWKILPRQPNEKLPVVPQEIFDSRALVTGGISCLRVEKLQHWSTLLKMQNSHDWTTTLNIYTHTPLTLECKLNAVLKENIKKKKKKKRRGSQ